MHNNILYEYTIGRGVGIYGRIKKSVNILAEICFDRRP
jgi:hypothetical protein